MINNSVLYKLEKYRNYNQSANYKAQQTCFIFDLDHSSAIRLIKHLKSMILIFENPFLGSGFWSSQYIFGYIPDSILQIPLETGTLGILIILYIFFQIYKSFKDNQSLQNPYVFLSLILVSVGLLSISIFANMLYEWRYLFMLMLSCYYYTKKV